MGPFLVHFGSISISGPFRVHLGSIWGPRIGIRTRIDVQTRMLFKQEFQFRLLKNVRTKQRKASEVNSVADSANAFGDTHGKAFGDTHANAFGDTHIHAFGDTHTNAFGARHTFERGPWLFFFPGVRFLTMMVLETVWPKLVWANSAAKKAGGLWDWVGSNLAACLWIFSESVPMGASVTRLWIRCKKNCGECTMGV